MPDEQKPIEQSTEPEVKEETEEERIDRIAHEWIADGKIDKTPPKLIRKRVFEIQPSKKKLKELAVRVRKDQKIIVQKERMDLFLAEFIRNGGNATQAAATVFNTTTAASANAIGHNYLQKAKLLGRVHMEAKGYHFGKMLDVALQKMEEGRNPDWWDRLMKIAEYPNPIADKKATPTTVNIISAQKSIADDFGFAEAEEGEFDGTEEV